MNQSADEPVAVRSTKRRSEIVDAAPPGIELTTGAATAHLRPARLGTALLQQQCWSWGRDVRRIEGNLLLEYGFVRNTPPKEDWGSSCYTYTMSASSTIRLWGFGVLHSDARHGSIFLQRTSFEPKLTVAAAGTGSVWRPDQVGRLRTPKLPADGEAVLALLPPLLAWIGAYEQWVVDTYGVDYRRRALLGWESVVVDPEEVPDMWWELAAGWRELLSSHVRA